MDETEKNLRAELESTEAAFVASQSGRSSDSADESKVSVNAEPDTEVMKSATLEKLENKKKELV